MNSKLAKKMRREIRRSFELDSASGAAMFVKSVQQSGLRARAVFAFRVLFNVWPDQTAQKDTAK